MRKKCRGFFEKPLHVNLYILSSKPCSADRPAGQGKPRSDRDLLLTGGKVGAGCEPPTTRPQPGLHVELKPPVVPVAGVCLPVVPRLAPSHVVPARPDHQPRPPGQVEPVRVVVSLLPEPAEMMEIRDRAAAFQVPGGPPWDARSILPPPGSLPSLRHKLAERALTLLFQ